jgi:hypothetical protein
MQFGTQASQVRIMTEAGSFSNWNIFYIFCKRAILIRTLGVLEQSFVLRIRLRHLKLYVGVYVHK